MSVQLNVPYVTQLQIGGHVKGNKEAWDDPTGCWYASVCMIGYFFEQGPRHGLPELFNQRNINHTQHQPISKPIHDRLLMQREGLENVPESDKAQNYTADQIQNLVTARGPTLFYWRKSFGGKNYGHASVLVGCKQSNVLYQDPENSKNGGQNRKMSIANFNRTRMFDPGVYGLLQRANLRDMDILAIRRKTVGKSVSSLRAKFGG